MSKRVFMPTKKTKAYTVINISLFVLLFFFLAQATSTDNDFYLYATIVVTGIAFIWIFVFTLLLKVKITINHKQIYCYGYPYSEEFQIKDDEKMVFRTILFEQIEFIEQINISLQNSHKQISAIRFKLKNDDDFCTPLDKFSEEVVKQILVALNDEFPFSMKNLNN